MLFVIRMQDFTFHFDWFYCFFFNILNCHLKVETSELQ